MNTGPKALIVHHAIISLDNQGVNIHGMMYVILFNTILNDLCIENK